MDKTSLSEATVKEQPASKQRLQLAVWLPWLQGLVILALSLLVAAPFFDVPMQRDQGVYAACGSVLLHGGAPYRDCWDTKAPLTHYTYALAQLIFGIDLKGPVILSTVLTALTGIALWRVSRRWFGNGIAWAIGLTYALIVISIPFDMNAQSEGFANLFIALSLWALLIGMERNSRWALIGAGVALAFAVGYKYTILLPAGAAVGALLIVSTPIAKSRLTSWWQTGWPIAIGFVGSIALFTLYLLARGALSFAFEHLVFMLTEFPKVQVNPILLLFPGESDPPLFYLQRTWYEFARLPILHLLGIAGSVVAIVKRRAWAWPIAIWLIASIASVYPQKVMTLYHWTLSLAPLALGVGALVWELRRYRVVVVAAALLMVGNIGLRFYADQWLLVEKYLTGQQTKTEFYASQAIGDEIEVAEYLRDRTSPDELIWVWGNHSIMYYWSDRRSPTRFIFNSPLMAAIGPNDYQPRWKGEVLDALKAAPPTYIVITYYDRTWFDYDNPVDQFAVQPGYQEFLDTYYRKEVGIGRFVLYRLTPWWSRYNDPTLLNAVTAVDLLAGLDSATLHPAPNEPIIATEFKLYDEAAHATLLMHPEGSVTFDVTLPQGIVCFRADLALSPESWGWGGDGAAFGLAINGEHVFEQTVGNTPDDRFWQPVIVDLSRWAGQTVSLTLSTGPGLAGDFTGDLAGWGLPRLVRSPGSACESQVIVK